MKIKTRKFVCLLIITISTMSFVSNALGRSNAGVDLSMRRAIYIASSKTAIDLKNDKYVTPNSTIKVKKSDALICQGDKCTFNLGVIAFRSDGNGALSTYGQFSGNTIGIVGNTISFNAGEKTKQHVLPVPLKIGLNEITFTVDPNKKTAETDENNNEITVKIIVEP